MTNRHAKSLESKTIVRTSAAHRREAQFSYQRVRAVRAAAAAVPAIFIPIREAVVAGAALDADALAEVIPKGERT